MIRELADVFVARFLERDPTGSCRTNTLREVAEKSAHWIHTKKADRIFREAIAQRFGDSLLSYAGNNINAAVRFNAAYTTALAWAVPRSESVLYWPGLSERPSPEQQSSTSQEAKKEVIVEDPQPGQAGKVDDRSAHARLDRLWRFATDQNERLIKVEQALGEIGEGLDERIDTVSERLDALEEEKRKHCKEQENLESAFDRRIFRLEHEPIKREEKIGLHEEKLNDLRRALDELYSGLGEIATSTMKRLNAQEAQIAHLQDVLKAVAETLPKEFA